MKIIDGNEIAIVSGGEARHTGGSNESYGDAEPPCGFDSWGSFDDYMDLQRDAIDAMAAGVEQYLRVPLPDGLMDKLTEPAKDGVLGRVIGGSKCDENGNIGGSVVAP